MEARRRRVRGRELAAALEVVVRPLERDRRAPPAAVLTKGKAETGGRECKEAVRSGRFGAAAETGDGTGKKERACPRSRKQRPRRNTRPPPAQPCRAALARRRLARVLLLAVGRPVRHAIEGAGVLHPTHPIGRPARDPWEDGSLASPCMIASPCIIASPYLGISHPGQPPLDSSIRGSTTLVGGLMIEFGSLATRARARAPQSRRWSSRRTARRRARAAAS